MQKQKENEKSHHAHNQHRFPNYAEFDCGILDFSEGLISLFVKEPGVAAYGTVFLRRMCVAICFHFFDFLVVNIFQTLGMGKRALVFAIIRKIVLEIPLLFILNYLNPL